MLASVGGTLFYLQFRHLDKEEDHLNMLPTGQFGDKHDEAVSGVGGAAPTAMKEEK